MADIEPSVKWRKKKKMKIKKKLRKFVKKQVEIEESGGKFPPLLDHSVDDNKKER